MLAKSIRIWFCLYWLFLCFLSGCVGSIPANYDTEKWIDEALLSDGRTVEVSSEARASLKRLPEFSRPCFFGPTIVSTLN
jgi:hypothetical protein